MNYKTRKSSYVRDFDLPKKIILENAYDPYHVENVHGNSVKSCERIYEYGIVSILKYEIYTFPKFKLLKNFTKKFLVIKITSENNIQFYSIPSNFEFVSKLIINCEELNDNKTKYVAKFYLKPMSFFLNILSPLILFLRNKGEKIRLKEDYELMKLRQKAINENHQDNLHCVNKKMLVDSWFTK